MTRTVIAYAGRQGSGKDYHCNLLEQVGYKKLAYADALRRILFVTLGIPYEEGMAKYDELKKTPLYNGQTLRNMLEHLGTEGIRYYDNDFWAKCLLVEIDKLPEGKNVCVSDLRFPNEYYTLKKYCEEKGYQFELIFCDYHSDRYVEDNNHASARMANFLKNKGYTDLMNVKESDIDEYVKIESKV